MRESDDGCEVMLSVIELMRLLVCVRVCECVVGRIYVCKFVCESAYESV